MSEMRYKSDFPAKAESLAGPHYYCEDCWYSCPLAEDGCCDASKPKDRCDCGRDRRVAAILEVLEEAYGMGHADA
jgi:hypothetical protein